MNTKHLYIETKSEAIAVFGSTQTAAGEAIGISRSAMSNLPEQLSDEYAARFTGAAALDGLLDGVTVKGTPKRLVSCLPDKLAHTIIGLWVKHGMI